MNCEEVRVYLEGCGAGPPECDRGFGISDFGLGSGTPGEPQPAAGNPQSAIRNPQSAIRNPKFFAAAVAEHLRQCADCTEYAARLAEENRALEDALAKPPLQERWQRVKAGLERRLALELAWRRRSHRVVWALAAAAAVVLCLGAGFLAYRHLLPSTGEELVADQNPPPSGGAGQPVQDALASGLARLQEAVRSKQLLDELEQLQIVFREAGDEDGKSAAEDAELYVERILALDGSRPEQAGEILAGIKAAGIQGRMQKVRESLADDAPAPLRASLELAAATLDQAVCLATEK